MFLPEMQQYVQMLLVSSFLPLLNASRNLRLNRGHSPPEQILPTTGTSTSRTMTQTLQQPFSSVTSLIPGMGGSGGGAAVRSSHSSSPYPTASATATTAAARQQPPPSQTQAEHQKLDNFDVHF